jgi:hypothetical protein
VGYTAETLAAYKAKRDLPYFAQTNDDSPRSIIIREWQARVFTQKIAQGQEHLYRLTIALKDSFLSKMIQPDLSRPNVFSGIIYPSTAMWLLGDNVAILPSEVDSKMDMCEVIFLTLDSVQEVHKEDGGIETKMAMKTYDYARSDSNNNLVWGQKSQIIYPPGVDASKFSIQLLPPE